MDETWICLFFVEKNIWVTETGIEIYKQKKGMETGNWDLGESNISNGIWAKLCWGMGFISLP